MMKIFYHIYCNGRYRKSPSFYSSVWKNLIIDTYFQQEAGTRRGMQCLKENVIRLVCGEPWRWWRWWMSWDHHSSSVAGCDSKNIWNELFYSWLCSALTVWSSAWQRQPDITDNKHWAPRLRLRHEHWTVSTHLMSAMHVEMFYLPVEYPVEPSLSARSSRSINC